MTTHAIAHELVASWLTAEGAFMAAPVVRCEPIPGWRHRGDTPAAVLEQAHRLAVDLARRHPDAQALKVDIVEALIEHTDDGSRRIGASRINQVPSGDTEAAAFGAWLAARTGHPSALPARPALRAVPTQETP